MMHDPAPPSPAGEDPATPTDLWFDGPGIRIHGLDWGGPERGPVVLMLHGVGGNAWIWADVAPRLRAGLPGHRIVAIDQREGGDTDHPPTGYLASDFAADVAAVHDQLGGGPLVLVGHSRGGWLAAYVAATAPERVERLVLVDPARLTFEDAAATERFYAWVRGAQGPFDGDEAALDWARAHDRRATWSPTRVRSFLFGYRRAPDGVLTSKIPAGVVDELQRARTIDAPRDGILGQIEARTLVLVATRQSDARVADKLVYADSIRNAEMARIDGTHFLHTDCPEEVAERIVGFVSVAD
jgi:pimeloyl-ACP methyl ester carboxylesterase